MSVMPHPNLLEPPKHLLEPLKTEQTARWAPAVAAGSLIAYGAARRDRTGLALAVVGGGMLYAAMRRINSPPAGHAWIRVERSITVNSPAGDLYRFWHDLENLPRIMHHLLSVTELDPRHSRWVATAPLGRTVKWDAEITEEEPDRAIHWRSTTGDIEHTGAVEFLPAPTGRGTVVKVCLQYAPPAGRLGSMAAKLTGKEPSIQLGEDLRRFKQLVEAGEVATIEGQPACRD